MERRPPRPVCKAFLLCRQILQDAYTTEGSLIGLVARASSPEFPFQFRVSAFASFSGGHGEYRLELQGEDVEGEPVWQKALAAPYAMDDPLRTYHCVIQNLPMMFPRPGKYSVLLFANGEEIARETFHADLQEKKPAS